MGVRFDTGTDLVLRGNVDMANASTVTYKAGAMADAGISSSADVTWSKVQGQFTVVTQFGLERTATPVTKDRIVWEARAAGVIEGVYAGLFESGSSTNIDLDFKLDGTTVMSGGPIRVVHGTGDHTVVAGTLTTTTFVAGAVFSMEITTVTSSTGAQGPYMSALLTYNAIPT